MTPRDDFLAAEGLLYDHFLAPPPAPAPAPVPVNAVSFGSFPGGSTTVEYADATSGWHWDPSHVVYKPGGPRGNGYAQITADDTTIVANANAMVRVQAMGFKAGNPAWLQNGGHAARALTLWAPSGFTNSRFPTVDELHGDTSLRAPAMYALAFQRVAGGYTVTIIIRGSTATAPLTIGYPFAQTIFGPPLGSTYDGQYFRHHQDWSGGNPVIPLGQPCSLKLEWPKLDLTAGQFRAQAKWGAMTAYKEIVPLVTVPNSYPDVDGGGALYPVMCLYYDTGGGGPNSVCVSDGSWAPSLAELPA